jgi:hypothetical protein
LPSWPSTPLVRIYSMHPSVHVLLMACKQNIGMYA